MVRFVPPDVLPAANLRRCAVSQSDLVLFSVDNHVALITVNDPDQRDMAVDAEQDQVGRGHRTPPLICRRQHITHHAGTSAT